MNQLHADENKISNDDPSILRLDLFFPTRLPTVDPAVNQQ